MQSNLVQIRFSLQPVRHLDCFERLTHDKRLPANGIERPPTDECRPMESRSITKKQVNSISMLGTGHDVQEKPSE
jgi:hypothetical protein